MHSKVEPVSLDLNEKRGLASLLSAEGSGSSNLVSGGVVSVGGGSTAPSEVTVRLQPPERLAGSPQSTFST